MTHRGLPSENTIETSQAKHFQRLTSAQFAKKLLKIAKFVKEFVDSVICTVLSMLNTGPRRPYVTLNGPRDQNKVWKHPNHM